MKPGIIRCPLCKRPARLNPRSNTFYPHWATLSRPGGGFRTLANRCEASNRRPEDLEES
jgi:hypothetical protein